MEYLGFYQVTERLQELFKAQGFRTITLDEERELDLKRQSLYPLAHIVPIQSTLQSSTNDFGFILMVLDLTDWNKNDIRDEEVSFYGIDNRQDILHTLFEKLRQVIQDFATGDSYTNLMRTSLPVPIDPFIADFENILTGWTAQITISVPNSSTIC